MSYKPMILDTDNGRKMQKERMLTQYNITDPKDGTIQGIYDIVVRAHAHPDLPEDSSDSEWQEQCVQSLALEHIHPDTDHRVPKINHLIFLYTISQ